MKNKRIWLFYISFLVSFQLLIGQQKDETVSIEVSDSLSASEKTPLSLRFGVDLYRVILSQVSDDFYGIEIVSDLRLGENFFLALELGDTKTTKEVDQVNFTTSGNYYKLGFDYNMNENLKGMNNDIYIGLRFASSNHTQVLNSYTILDRSRFWPSSDLPVDIGYATGERSNLNAQWIEVVCGFKVQLLKNIYMGLSLRLNRLLKDKIPENFDNIYIPGFNKKTEERIQNKVSEKTKNLTTEEKNNIVKLATSLQKRQESHDDPEILPKVTKEDIPKERKYPSPLISHSNNTTNYYYKSGTNGIIYHSMLFPCDALNNNELAVASLFSNSITDIGLGNDSFTGVWVPP